MEKKLENLIPYGHQEIDDADIKAVVEVLESDWLTQGNKVPDFEESVAKKFKAAHAVALNSATSALHVACLALDIGETDIVWTSSNSFVASANCALYCGAEVDFVDIDPDTYNLCVDKLEKKLIQAKQSNTLPKVLIPVHLCGQPCDMKRMYELSREYGFNIIEDASHALGSKIGNEPIGSCRWSDVVIFSFHPVKIITTGEGGMALTNRPDLMQRMKLLRSHGITRNRDILSRKNHIPPWYYEQILLGYNYRMTDIQAALGLSQLDKLDLFVEKRNQLAANYDRELSSLRLQLPRYIAGNYSSFHLYVVLVELHLAGSGHFKIFQKLRSSGIGVNLHYMPIYLQPYFRNIGFQEGYCPISEDYSQRAISLPIFPSLTDIKQKKIIDTLKKVLP